MLLKKIVVFILALCALTVFVKEAFASVGTEVWQSTRAKRPTRNMSYDIRGQPVSAAFNPYISPWNISTLPITVARHPTNLTTSTSNSYLSPDQFKTNSIGLTLGPDKTIQKGYLKGWPASGNDPGWWINPALLNTSKRWSFYKF